MNHPNLVNSYARLDVAFSHGNGVHLYDEDGKEYFDAITGIGVNALGHNHPKIVEAVCEQASQLLHTSNMYRIPMQETLADELCQISGMSRAFICNSGTETTECAIKITRLFARTKQYQNPKVIVFNGGFHGRSFAAMSATINPKIHLGFEPLLPGFIPAKFNDIKSVERIFTTEKEIVGVFLEPIQGEGGIHIATDAFLKGLKDLCQKNDALLIFDEVQCGLGRTGSWFAGHSREVPADILTLAKPLGGGVPIGVCLVNSRADLIKPGKHGTTFGGNPLAARAALAFLAAMKEEHLMDNVTRQAQSLIPKIKSLFSEPCYQIRAKGLMIGIEISLEAKRNEIVQNLPKNALELGLLINVTSGNVIRMLPPFIMDELDVAELLHKLELLKNQFLDPV